MNPQPEPYVGNLFALLFTLMIVFYAIKAFLSNTNNHTISDLFTIGYIESDTPPIINVNAKIHNSEPNIESHQLYIDCIDALYAIGVKKSEAKKITKHIFTKHKPRPKSVQEFLIIAMSK